MALTAKSFADLVTFSRASTATRVNAAGQIELVAADVPRMDYDPVTLLPRGLLLEEASTNLQTYSEASTANWTNNSATLTDLSGEYLGIFQGVEVASNGSTPHRLSPPALAFSSGVTYAITAFYKAGTSGVCRLMAYADGGALNANLTGTCGALAANTTTGATISGVKNKDWGNGIYSVEFLYTPSAAYSAHSWGIGPNSATSGETVIALGVQVEQKGQATSYIPTTSSQASRAGEYALIDGAAFSEWFSPSVGTIYVEFEIEYDPSGGSYPRIFQIDNAANNDDRIFGAVFEGGDSLRTGVYSSNTSQAYFTLATAADGSLAGKLALAFSEDDFAASFNGSAAATDTAGTTTPSAERTRMFLGSTTSGDANRVVRIKDLRFYSSRKSNTELQEMTA